jgi:hypothetical protein
VAARPPEGWKDTHQHGAAADNLGCEPLSETEEGVEVDPLVCPKCGPEMKDIAISENLDELGRILRYLVKLGRAPPGFDPDRLS